MIDAITITVEYPTACMVCGQHLPRGTKAKWLKDVGTWCVGHATPTNARVYQREAEQRRSLGIDPPEFGSAPMLKDPCPAKTHDGQRCVLGKGHEPADWHETETKVRWNERLS